MAPGLFDPAIFRSAAGSIDFLNGFLRASTEHPIIGLGLDGTIVLWNEGARRAYGYTPEDVVGRANISILHDREDIEAGKLRQMLAAAARLMRWEGNLKQRRKNGQQLTMRAVVTSRRDASGKCVGFLMTSGDAANEIRLIEEVNAEREARARAETALRESDEHYQIVIAAVTDTIISVGETGVVVFVNAAAERTFGYRAIDILGRKLNKLIPGSLRQLRRARVGSVYAAGHTRVVWEAVDVRGTHRDGRSIPLEVSFSVSHRSGRRFFTGIIRDTSERKRADEKILHLAQYDALTELPNRALLQDRVEHALAHARRNRKKVAVLFLDLDNFKHINDSLGHQTGDQLLRMVSQRLRRCVRDGDSIGRLGGDEFVISLPAVIDDGDAALVAGKILESLRTSFQVDGHELHVRASIGISLFPTDGEDATTLMRAADTAMYHAKEKGRNNYRFFTPKLNEAARQRLVVTSRLHQALERGEFSLVYQPQVELASGRIFAAEALIRWRAENGITHPGEFIKVAEETGLIVPIGEWVLREACQQLALLRRTGYSDLRMAVNLSPEQIRHSGFPNLVYRVLRETGLPAAALDLEITEGVLMRQSMENIAHLTQLAGTGIQFAVDDFGTGYSSLAYLQRFPIDTIKIDRSFLRGVGEDPNNSAIVTAIIAMARNLKLHIVAEGVETASQVDFLKIRGCLAAQGFYFHAPVPAEIFRDLLEKQAAVSQSHAAEHG